MAENKIQLGARIAKLRPDYESEYAEWFNAPPNSELPTVIKPFFVQADRGDCGTPKGTYSVRVISKRGDHPAVLEGLPCIYSAIKAMVDAVEAWEPYRPVEQVYFIGTVLKIGQNIKVGYSRDPQGRIRSLQTAHGEPLQIFATVPGGKDLEAKYHRRWHSRRRSGEWFTIGQCIIDEIERIKATVR